MRKKDIIVNVLGIIIGIIIGILLLITIKSYNKYKCSITEDISWYIKHQCYYLK
jgi:uncharacterized protein YacL